MSGGQKQPDETESEDDLTVWADGVVASVTPKELAGLIKDYRELSQNKRRSSEDREFAKCRWQALLKIRP